jgi:hypothetical protein
MNHTRLEEQPMHTGITTYCLAAIRTVRRRLTDAKSDEGAISGEYLMWVGIAVAIAITVGAIVTALLVAKAHSINLN